MVFHLEAHLHGCGDSTDERSAAGALQKTGLAAFEFRAAADAGGRVEVLGRAEESPFKLRHAPLSEAVGEVRHIYYMGFLPMLGSHSPFLTFSKLDFSLGPPIGVALGLASRISSRTAALSQTTTFYRDSLIIKN